MTVLQGKELADKLYQDWKNTSVKIPSMFLDQLPEEWRTAEELDSELAHCLIDTEAAFGVMLKHPLVFGIPYFVQDNPRYNYGLHWKRECLEKYAASRDFSQFIHAHERPYRCEAVQTIIDNFEPNGCEVWTCARTAWTDSENIFQNEYEWRSIFEDWYDEGREFFMTTEDHEEWAMISDDEPVIVYRGFCVDGRDQGMSWTTDKIRAKFFARRFAEAGVRGKARLAIGQVMKCDCIGYLNSRNESEVVVFPENIDIIRVGEVPTK